MYRSINSKLSKKSTEFSAIFSKKSWKTLRERKNNPIEAKYLKIAVNFQQLKTLSSRPSGDGASPIPMFFLLSASTVMSVWLQYGQAPVKLCP
jgi:hypothetical protein